MKSALKILLTALLSVTLMACQEDESSAPDTRPGKGSGAPEPPVSCEKYVEFLEVFKSMKDHEVELSAQAGDGNRVALASALFAEKLRNNYAAASAMRDYSTDVQSRYLKYFSWIFTGDGHVRSSPAHPLSKHCQGKE